MVKKLGIKAQHRVLVDRAPADFVNLTLGPVACELLTERAGKGLYDMVIAFRRDRRSYVKWLDRDISRIERDGTLWVAWPKKSSGIKTDIDENVVRSLALDAGVVDVKVCAIDATWSGLKLVYRLSER